jgi:hypothetical protein
MYHSNIFYIHCSTTARYGGAEIDVCPPFRAFYFPLVHQLNSFKYGSESSVITAEVLELLQTVISTHVLVVAVMVSN